MAKEVKSLLGRAIVFATGAHEGQLRKGTKLPYILHPLEVATICTALTDDEEILAAAVLHDTVEDTGATLEEIRELFGDRVAAIVEAQSEDKMRDRKASDTWRERKEESLKHLRAAEDPGAQIVYLADKLSNIRITDRDLNSVGDVFWQRFNQRDPLEHGWYYRSVADILEPDLGDTATWNEYNSLLHDIFDRYDQE